MSDKLNTEGFYKQDGENVMFAPNFVISPNYELWKELKDTYSYPLSGWSWFASIEEAYASFGLEIKEEE